MTRPGRAGDAVQSRHRDRSRHRVRAVEPGAADRRAVARRAGSGRRGRRRRRAGGVAPAASLERPGGPRVEPVGREPGAGRNRPGRSRHRGARRRPFQPGNGAAGRGSGRQRQGAAPRRAAGQSPAGHPAECGAALGRRALASGEGGVELRRRVHPVLARCMRSRSPTSGSRSSTCKQRAGAQSTLRRAFGDLTPLALRPADGGPLVVCPPRDYELAAGRPGDAHRPPRRLPGGRPARPRREPRPRRCSRSAPATSMRPLRRRKRGRVAQRAPTG